MDSKTKAASFLLGTYITLYVSAHAVADKDVPRDAKHITFLGQVMCLVLRGTSLSATAVRADVQRDVRAERKLHCFVFESMPNDDPESPAELAEVTGQPTLPVIPDHHSASIRKRKQLVFLLGTYITLYVSAHAVADKDVPRNTKHITCPRKVMCLVLRGTSLSATACALTYSVMYVPRKLTAFESTAE